MLGSGLPFGSRIAGSVLPMFSAETQLFRVTPPAGRLLWGGGAPLQRWPNSLQRYDVSAPRPDGSLTELTAGFRSSESPLTEQSSSLVRRMMASLASDRRKPPLSASSVGLRLPL